MILQENLILTGNWLFRWRSYIPLIMITIYIPALNEYEFFYSKREYTTYWGIFSLIISMIGLLIRIIVAGYTPQNTSGKNTKEQVADVLNTKGLYSMVRHPLYLGNYFMGLGVSLFLFIWWLPLIYTLSFALYYERIMLAEENFLRKKFGEDMETWANGTPGFFPNFSKWQSSKLKFSYVKVLRSEYSSFFALIFSFTLLDLFGNYMILNKIFVVPIWNFLFCFSIVIYFILRALKKHSKFLKV